MGSEENVTTTSAAEEETTVPEPQPVAPGAEPAAEDDPSALDAQANPQTDLEPGSDEAAVQANAEGADAEAGSGSAAALPHIVSSVDGDSELHVTKNGETSTVAIVEGDDHTDTIEVNTLELEGSIAAAAPTNPGESLGTSPTNPAVAPVAPGIEPGMGEDDSEDETMPEGAGGPPLDAPPSTDPGGDTSKENAPNVPAAEPEGPNVTTNPGTESNSESQVEAPESPEGAQPVGGETPIGGVPIGGQDAPEPGTGGGEQPDTGVTSGVTAMPLYLDGGEGYTDAGLETPDGRQLYTFDQDTAGSPHTGDAELYAEADDDTQPVSPVA